MDQSTSTNWRNCVCVCFLLAGVIGLVLGQGNVNLGPLSNRILENRATGNCLTLSRDHKLIMDTCNYNLDDPQISGVFTVGHHFKGGQLLRWKTGTQFEAPEGCLQALQAFKPKRPAPADEEDEDEDDEEDSDELDDDHDDYDFKAAGGGTKGRGEVRLVLCNHTDDTLNWEFKRKVLKKAEADLDDETGGKYQVKKTPDGPCLAGWSLRGQNGQLPSVFTMPCNADDDRQVWRICEDVAPVKCDP